MQMIKRGFLLVLLTISFPELVQAQEFSVSGRVIDADNGEPLPYVNIGILNSSKGTSTNVDGYFTLHNVSSDTSVLVFNMVGYQQFKRDLSSVKSVDDLIIRMVSTTTHMEEVVVTGSDERSAFKLNKDVSKIRITPAQLGTLPQIGGGDIFRSFQLMPGVSAGNEHTAGLYVRGGTPDQNLVLFDGFPVYNVDHMFGFFSAFNANAVKDVQLYKGGFPPKYGGRLSSVVELTGKEGNKQEFNAGADISMLSVNGYVEGPIGSKLSGLITFRQSFKSPFYDKIADMAKGEPAVDAPGNSGTDLVSYFNDLNAKLTYNPTEKDVLNWSFYTGRDMLDNSISSQAGDLNDITKWGNTGTSLRWSRQWNSELYSTTSVSYSNYFSSRENMREIESDEDEEDIKAGIAEDNDLKDVTLKSDFEWNINEHHTIGMGVQFKYNDISYRYTQNDTTSLINRHSQGNTYTVYLQDELRLLQNKLSLTPGVRAAYFESTEKLYYSPRLNLEYNVTDKLKLKGSVGQYHQFAKRVIKENVMQGSRDFWVLSDGNKLPVSSSQQYVAGASWENSDYLFDMELYYKRLEGLSEYTMRFQPGGGTVNYEELFYKGSGYAKGIDILLQKKFGKYNGWISYTLGEVKHNFPIYGKEDYYAVNDVRHEFKIVHSYRWKKFNFSLTWSYLTGKPYTAPTGNYQINLLDGTTEDYFSISEKNGLRLPDYHRLDASITYNYDWPSIGNGTVGLSLFNIYNRQNIWYKNYQIEDNQIVETPVEYLGFTPNLTLTFNLK